MDKELQDRIEALRAKLRTSNSADPELEQLLRDLDRDIQTMLDRPRDSRSLAPESLAERLRAIGVRFASRHPRLQPILEELANLLASIGI
jgi:uncharacterized protein involved in exopolysaccharide biosynthesis